MFIRGPREALGCIRGDFGGPLGTLAPYWGSLGGGLGMPLGTFEVALGRPCEVLRGISGGP